MPMSIASIAAAAAASHAAATRTALATEIVKQQHEAQAEILNVIEAAAKNLESVTGPAAPEGGNLDISV